MAIRTITHSKEILSVILGGGAGSRLYPLTASRCKPAVPIAGKYRLVDIPISNCLNNGIGRMFVLTQFNSASLNRHIKNTYHFSAFSKAFVIYWLQNKHLIIQHGSRELPMQYGKVFVILSHLKVIMF